MPVTQSAKKAAKQSLKRKKRNLVYKENVKKVIKQAKALASHKKNDEAAKLLPQIYSALDKAAKAGVIKKNNASRHKARLTNLITKKTA